MKLAHSAFALALMLGAATTASAQTATQTVTFSVTDVNTVAVSGNPAPMSVSAGGAGATATDATTTYDVSTNSSVARKITAQITTGGDMPAGVTLSAALADPDGAGAAASAGAQTLVSTVAKDVVTGITNLSATGRTITYSLSATTAAAAVSGATRVVTYTIQ